MKTLPTLRIVCEGTGEAWTARVTGVGGHRPQPEDAREWTATSAREAVRIAISRFGKEPRTCRRCGRTWECRRTRAIRICPACQVKRATVDMVPFIVNRESD